MLTGVGPVSEPSPRAFAKAASTASSRTLLPPTCSTQSQRSNRSRSLHSMLTSKGCRPTQKRTRGYRLRGTETDRASAKQSKNGEHGSPASRIRERRPGEVETERVRWTVCRPVRRWRRELPSQSADCGSVVGGAPARVLQESAKYFRAGLRAKRQYAHECGEVSTSESQVAHSFAGP